MSISPPFRAKTTMVDGRGTIPFRRLLSAVLALLAGACSAPPAQPASAPAPAGVEFLAPPGDWPYPFSPAVRVGNMLYLSGQIGSRMENGAVVLVPGGIEPETRQTMENISEILERSGSSLDRVVKCTVMMADMSEWPRMNTIYATFFPGSKPARSAFGANGLALGARVEIECAATVD